MHTVSSSPFFFFFFFFNDTATTEIYTLSLHDALPIFNGVQDNTKSFDVTGALRVIVVQENTGTLGTAGIDVVSISKDGGKQWSPATDGLAIDSDDSTGPVLVSAALHVPGGRPLR